MALATALYFLSVVAQTREKKRLCNSRFKLLRVLAIGARVVQTRASPCRCRLTVVSPSLFLFLPPSALLSSMLRQDQPKTGRLSPSLDANSFAGHCPRQFRPS
ncbi:hypothetical protein JCGZ_03846 [Jatropha curcas]|uniref:Uncharacterized protein n=1 Tax=Jatropha curcas TaxID=180498 RepID=A0A067KW51_JATCU|nr:hypothetical protein JCGZ_03846 [Jatropha curcas]